MARRDKIQDDGFRNMPTRHITHATTHRISADRLGALVLLHWLPHGMKNLAASPPEITAPFAMYVFVPEGDAGGVHRTMGTGNQRQAMEQSKEIFRIFPVRVKTTAIIRDSTLRRGGRVVECT